MELIMMVGIPGSGKSEYVDEHKGDAYVISPDNERLNFTYSYEFSKEINQKVHKCCNYKMHKCINEGKSVIFDAMNLNKSKRKQFVKYYHKYFDKFTCIYVKNKDIDDAVKRNGFLKRSIIESLNAKLKEPTCDEGWDEIIVVDNTPK